jgi:hypothetical protein
MKINKNSNINFGTGSADLKLDDGLLSLSRQAASKAPLIGTMGVAHQ